MAPFDLNLAVRLFTELYTNNVGWECPDEVERIAAICGLGVVSVRALDEAVWAIRSEFYSGRRFDAPARARFAALDITQSAPRWARAIEAAAVANPDPTAYPIVAPPGHRVGHAPCFGPARKGPWSADGYRAAWGNAEPYGLAVAVKLCPACGREMHFWCRGRKDGDKRWSVDHVTPHARGGCVCSFNLRAICPACNSAKGARRASLEAARLPPPPPRRGHNVSGTSAFGPCPFGRRYGSRRLSGEQPIGKS